MWRKLTRRFKKEQFLDILFGYIDINFGSDFQNEKILIGYFYIFYKVVVL